MERAGVELDLERARAGDPAALELLCSRFGPRLLRYVERNFGAKTRRWIEPEDIVQVVLLETLRDLGSASDEITEAELIRRALRTARSRIIDAVRAHQKRIGQSRAPRTPSACEAPTVSQGIVTRADETRWLYELVAVLPPKYRAVVEAIALRHRTRDEVAEELGLSPDAVQKRYERARDMLRARRMDQER